MKLDHQDKDLVHDYCKSDLWTSAAGVSPGNPPEMWHLRSYPGLATAESIRWYSTQASSYALPQRLNCEKSRSVKCIAPTGDNYIHLDDPI